VHGVRNVIQRGPRLLALLLFLLVPGCGDDVDAITGASRDPTAHVLTPEHRGWAQPDCQGCHGDPHASGYRAVQCAGCHGTNGAPRRPAGHANDGCVDCHAAAHPGLDVAPPGDCRGCHQPADPAR